MRGARLSRNWGDSAECHRAKKKKKIENWGYKEERKENG